MDVKVCHFTTVHSIDDVRIFTKECTSLANNGFDVTIIACGDIAFEDNKSGVKRILLKVPVKNRLNRFFKRSKAVYKKALEIDADIYHFHDPELIPTGLKLKKKGRKVIFDSHENTTQLIKSKYWIPKLLRNFISYAYMNYEKYAIRRFDAVISVTPSIVDKFKKITNSSYQITNYPNIFNNENLDKIEKSNIAFAGTISSS